MEKLPENKSKVIYQKIPIDDPKKRNSDIFRAKKLINWAPQATLDDGLIRKINYYLSIL